MNFQESDSVPEPALYAKAPTLCVSSGRFGARGPSGPLVPAQADRVRRTYRQHPSSGSRPQAQPFLLWTNVRQTTRRTLYSPVRSSFSAEAAFGPREPILSGYLGHDQ